MNNKIVVKITEKMLQFLNKAVVVLRLLLLQLSIHIRKCSRSNDRFKVTSYTIIKEMSNLQ